MILAAVYSVDNGQWLVRKYCGRYQWIGPYTVDALGSEKTFAKALARARAAAAPVKSEQLWPEDA